MLTTRGVAMSDGLNRKNHYFSLNAIINAYEAAWKQGTPSNLNHDSTKLIGWNCITGIFMEPGKAYVTNEMSIPETKKEHDTLMKKNMDYLYKKYYIDRKEKYDELKLMLADKLTDKSRPALISCVAYEEENILFKVFPEIKKEMNKGLIDINLMTPVYPGIFKKGEYLIFAHRYFRRNCFVLNSLNEEFLQRLQDLQTSGLKVQIALDINMIGLLGTENAELEYQYWWGPKFNEDLFSIPTGVTRHSNEHYDNLFTNLCFTEFGWYVQDGRQTFECEEVSDQPNIKDSDSEYYGCRFVHSMLNPITNLPNHLDGAIRAYTDEKMLERLDISIDKTERDTWYTKLWRIDNDMSVSLWKELITHYYRDNMLIGEYFSAEDEEYTKIVLEDKAEDEITPLQKYIPVDMNINDGIRIYYRYMPAIDINEEYDVVLKSNEFLVYEERRIRVMESETITILKLLKRYGLNIRIPATARIGHEDMVFNFPTFMCKNADKAKIVQKVIADLCKVWSDRNDNRLISYSIATNYENEAIYFSFAGHVSDFKSIFARVGTTFPQKDAVNKWIEVLYNENNKFPIATQHPKISDIMTDSSHLRFRRALVPTEYLQEIKMEDKFLTADFIVKKETAEELIKNKIGIAPIYHIEKTKCMSCQKDYISCDCVKFIDDISEEIQKFKLIGAAWTNRLA
ncbi:hypothetical protein [Acetobacterium malicum]|uniref:hypothetical protein n=1 Tax=Acetobacterium malicum TaxID=52692 RepID=UPI003593D17D